MLVFFASGRKAVSQFVIHFHHSQLETCMNSCHLIFFMLFIGDDFNESMKRNQMLASSAIKRAMSDANAGKLSSSLVLSRKRIV